MSFDDSSLLPIAVNPELINVPNTEQDIYRHIIDTVNDRQITDRMEISSLGSKDTTKVLIDHVTPYVEIYPGIQGRREYLEFYKKYRRDPCQAYIFNTAALVGKKANEGEYWLLTVDAAKTAPLETIPYMLTHLGTNNSFHIGRKDLPHPHMRIYRGIPNDAFSFTTQAESPYIILQNLSNKPTLITMCIGASTTSLTDIQPNSKPKGDLRARFPEDLQTQVDMKRTRDSGLN